MEDAVNCERELFRFICLFIRRPVMEHTEKEDAVDFFRFHTMEKMATDGWENPAQDMTIEARVKPTNSAKPIVYISLFKKNVTTKETSDHKILYVIIDHSGLIK